MNFINDMISAISHGGPKVHTVILVVCVILGILLLRLEAKILFRLIARKNDKLYATLEWIFKGMPTCFGVMTGIWWATKFIEAPPFVIQGMQHLNRSIFIMTIAIFIAHLASGFVRYKLNKSSSNINSTSILETTIDICVYAIGAMALLESLGISISPLLTALGVGGLATALALQDTMSNLFSGINTLLSKQVKIGDYVQLASGEAGHVVDMNWRNTTIKTITENMIVVPNQKIASSILTNYAQPYASCSIMIPVGVSYDSDLQHVEDVTLEVARQVLKDNDGGADGFEPMVRYRDFGGFSIDFDVFLQVKSIMDQRFIRHQFIKALFVRYKAEGIEIPTNPFQQ